VLLTSGFPDLRAGDAGGTRSPHRLLHKPYRSDARLREVGAAFD
jgi:hypothetical protein